jgi:O-antigen/teichoic acid export membrane protein
MVMAGGGADASKVAGLVFAATMLVRVPVFVFQGLATSLLPNLTRLHASAEIALFRRATSRVLALLTVCTIGIVAGAAILGSTAMRTVYGSEYVVGREELTVLGVGVGCYLAMATFSQALLALDRGRVAARAWSASAALFLLLYAALPGEPLMRVACAFATASIAGAAVLYLTLSTRLRGS